MIPMIAAIAGASTAFIYLIYIEVLLLNRQWKITVIIMMMQTKTVEDLLVIF